MTDSAPASLPSASFPPASLPLPTPDQLIKMGQFLGHAYEPHVEAKYQRVNKHDIRAAMILLEDPEFMAFVASVRTSSSRAGQSPMPTYSSHTYPPRTYPPHTPHPRA